MLSFVVFYDFVKLGTKNLMVCRHFLSALFKIADKLNSLKCYSERLPLEGKLSRSD